MGYSFQLTARVLLYAPSHREDSTYHREREREENGIPQGERGKAGKVRRVKRTVEKQTKSR